MYVLQAKLQPGHEWLGEVAWLGVFAAIMVIAVIVAVRWHEARKQRQRYRRWQR